MAEHTGATAAKGPNGDTARWLAGMARALSDPARARILLLLAQGRACCEGLERQAPATTDDGVSVCELEEMLGLRQSLVSYHLRVLKDAGLVRESRCGRWSYYALDREAVGRLANLMSALTQSPAPDPADPVPAQVAGAAPDGRAAGHGGDGATRTGGEGTDGREL